MRSAIGKMLLWFIRAARPAVEPTLIDPRDLNRLTADLHDALRRDRPEPQPEVAV